MKVLHSSGLRATCLEKRTLEMMTPCCPIKIHSHFVKAYRILQMNQSYLLWVKYKNAVYKALQLGMIDLTVRVNGCREFESHLRRKMDETTTKSENSCPNRIWRRKPNICL